MVRLNFLLSSLFYSVDFSSSKLDLKSLPCYFNRRLYFSEGPHNKFFHQVHSKRQKGNLIEQNDEVNQKINEVKDSIGILALKSSTCASREIGLSGAEDGWECPGLPREFGEDDVVCFSWLDCCWALLDKLLTALANVSIYVITNELKRSLNRLLHTNHKIRAKNSK